MNSGGGGGDEGVERSYIQKRARSLGGRGSVFDVVLSRVRLESSTPSCRLWAVASGAMRHGQCNAWQGDGGGGNFHLWLWRFVLQKYFILCEFITS